MEKGVRSSSVWLHITGTAKCQTSTELIPMRCLRCLTLKEQGQEVALIRRPSQRMQRTKGGVWGIGYGVWGTGYRMGYRTGYVM